MELDDLYRMIPSVPCPPGCITCCKMFGIPSRTNEEDRRIKAFLGAHGLSENMKGVARAEGGYTCPYVTATGCGIYPVRPFICRLYGASPNYLCIERFRPAVVLSEEEEETLFALYRSLFP